MRLLQFRQTIQQHAGRTSLTSQWLAGQRRRCLRDYHQHQHQQQPAGIGSIPLPKKPPSRFRKALAIAAFGVLFASIGCAVAVAPVVPGVLEALRPVSDEDSLGMYVPQDQDSKAIEDFINNHPLAAELRGNPDMTESRPHMKLAAPLRRHNLTGGTLLGPGRVTVPPFAWNEKGGKSLVSISHIGSDLCGHPGLVHGGFLATILDEGLARCCFAALPHNVAVTAKLEVNYRKPAPAGTFVVLRARTTKVDGRKAWVEGHIETLVGPGEQPTVLAEASALFISPKFAEIMAKLNATG